MLSTKSCPAALNNLAGRPSEPAALLVYKFGYCFPHFVLVRWTDVLAIIVYIEWSILPDSGTLVFIAVIQSAVKVFPYSQHRR